MSKSVLAIDNLDGYQFENLVARIMKKLGYTDVKVTQKSGDMGKDIIMTGHENGLEFPVIVECKHQKFVGRPVVQKLQGAMLHEKRTQPFIKGLIVTSGSFSPTVKEYVKDLNRQSNNQMEIELIDGVKLKKLCDEHHIMLLNGKVQVLADDCVKHMSSNQIKNHLETQFKEIVGSKKDLLKVQTAVEYYPCYQVQYNIDSQVSTSVGCIYSVQEYNQAIVLDGQKQGPLDETRTQHFFSEPPKIRKLSKEEQANIIPFEFTENDIEKEAIRLLIATYARNVRYTGGNNVSYNKQCKPKATDIEIIKGMPVFLPTILTDINIIKQKYEYKAYCNEDDLLVLKDPLNECIVCNGRALFDNELYLCPHCGKILCSRHKKLDKIDGTPICEEDAISMKLFLQSVYFTSEKNKEKYAKEWNEKNFIQKVIEDKVVIGLLITAIVLVSIFLISVIRA